MLCTPSTPTKVISAGYYANVVENSNNDTYSKTKSFESFESILMKHADQVGTLLNL